MKRSRTAIAASTAAASGTSRLASCILRASPEVASMAQDGSGEKPPGAPPPSCPGLRVPRGLTVALRLIRLGMIDGFAHELTDRRAGQRGGERLRQEARPL